MWLYLVYRFRFISIYDFTWQFDNKLQPTLSTINIKIQIQIQSQQNRDTHTDTDTDTAIH